MDAEFRQLDERERGLLEKLLEAPFPGRDELRAQLDSVTAKQIEKDGTLSLRVASGPPSPGKYLLAMEGTCKDVDGMMMSVMLHLDHGFMTMLEIIKYGQSAIIKPPTAEDLVLLRPEDGGMRPERKMV